MEWQTLFKYMHSLHVVIWYFTDKIYEVTEKVQQK